MLDFSRLRLEKAGSDPTPGWIRTIAQYVSSLVTWWRTLRLAQQFAIAGTMVLIPAMGAIGLWVASQIRAGVTQHSGAEAALYMNKYLAPMVQDLAHSERLSPSAIEQLDDLMRHAAVGKRIVSIKVWALDGTIVYSNHKPNVGRKYSLTPNFKLAAKGFVAAEFEGHYHEQDSHEQGLHMPLLEIYAPIRARATDEIIAIAEFYERADQLKEDLFVAGARSWLVVGVVSALMMAALAGIVGRGSRTIEEQRSEVQRKVLELQDLLAQNEELKNSVSETYKRSAEINECFQRRVGADLHDGPAQHLGLALLKIDLLRDQLKEPAPGGPDGRRELETVRSALSEAMKEVRDISAGLALPELDALTLEETLRLAARTHSQRSSTRVHCDIDDLPDDTPRILRICAYRFVQEALNNAWRHAGGEGQHITAGILGDTLQIEVSDTGKGIQQNGGTRHKGGGLGLPGMRDRIEVLGGTLSITSPLEGGTRLVARFALRDLKRMEQLDA